MYYICFKKIEKKAISQEKNIYTAPYSYKSPLYEKSDKPPGPVLVGSTYNYVWIFTKIFNLVTPIVE